MDIYVSGVSVASRCSHSRLDQLLYLYTLFEEPRPKRTQDSCDACIVIFLVVVWLRIRRKTSHSSQEWSLG